MKKNLSISGGCKVSTYLDVFRKRLSRICRYHQDQRQRREAFNLLKRVTSPDSDYFLGIALKSIDPEIRFDAIAYMDKYKFQWALFRILKNDPNCFIKLLALEKINFTYFPDFAYQIAISDMSAEVRIRLLEVVNLDIFYFILSKWDISEEADREFALAFVRLMDLARSDVQAILIDAFNSSGTSITILREIIEIVGDYPEAVPVLEAAARHWNVHIRRTAIRYLAGKQTNIWHKLCADRDLLVALSAVCKTPINDKCLPLIAASSDKQGHYEPICIKAAERLNKAGLLAPPLIYSMARNGVFSSQKSFAIRYLNPVIPNDRDVLWEIILDDRNTCLVRFQALERFKTYRESFRFDEYPYIKAIKDLFLSLDKKTIKSKGIIQETRILILSLVLGRFD